MPRRNGSTGWNARHPVGGGGARIRRRESAPRRGDHRVVREWLSRRASRAAVLDARARAANWRSAPGAHSTKNQKLAKTWDTFLRRFSPVFRVSVQPTRIARAPHTRGLASHRPDWGRLSLGKRGSRTTSRAGTLVPLLSMSPVSKVRIGVSRAPASPRPHSLLPVTQRPVTGASRRHRPGPGTDGAAFPMSAM